MLMAGYQKQTLFIDFPTLAAADERLNDAIAQAITQLRRFPNKCGFLSESPTRRGDFSLVCERLSLDPEIVMMISIPGKGRAPIVTTIYSEPE